MNEDYTGEDTAVNTVEARAVKIVKDDFSRGKKYLDKFHKQCIERYKHYIAPSLESNLDKDKSFPVPFTTEQVDTLVADMMEKLWYKDEPCSMYGRNDTDKADADVKREFMAYQDDRDDMHSKTRQAILHCCISKIAPAVVNYKEEYKTEIELQEQPMTDEQGLPILGMDGQTPMMVKVPVPVKKYTYQGASVELVDPIDFFFTQEKREVNDEHPMMIRSKRSMHWFSDKNYIRPEGIKELQIKQQEGYEGSRSEIEDLLDQRRSSSGFSMDESDGTKEHEYIEWQGYFAEEEGGEKELYIIGVVDDEILMRFQKHDDVFDIGQPNIVVGVIGREYGEIWGPSLIDKFHSVQHGMDTLLGIWIKNLRQTGNNMWIGNSSKMVTKEFTNEAGTFIDCMDDPDKVMQRIQPDNISQDVYAGLEMFRQMGQNATGLNDIASGVVQEGVETLGEANILAGQTALRSKGGYLRSFEKSFIEPLWKLRNQINIKFCTDVGYMYSVLEDGMFNWKPAEQSAIRSDVDFICEASVRENQRGVVTQQILQAINLTIKMADVLGPIPLIKLLERLYEEGFGWKQDTIRELLPLEAIAQQLMQRDMQQQQEMQAANQQSMPRPTNDSQVQASAQGRNETQTGNVA